MNVDLTGYGMFFKKGQWVGVDIPLSEGAQFQEKALVHAFSHDLLVLQTSRDLLPHSACLHVGTTVEIRLGLGASGFRCRAILVEKGGLPLISVRLVGDVISNDLREYFRIDINIPLTYYIPAVQTVKAVRGAWLERQGEGKASRAGETAPAPAREGSVRREPVPVAANLSGGGLRIRIPERLKSETLVNLRLYLPLSPPQVIDVVGQVVYHIPIYLRSGSIDLYDTAMRFHFIDEKDRDCIIRYIFTIQTQQISQIRQSFADNLGPGGHDRSGRKMKLFRGSLLVTAICLAAAILAAVIFWYYLRGS